MYNMYEIFRNMSLSSAYQDSQCPVPVNVSEDYVPYPSSMNALARVYYQPSEAIARMEHNKMCDDSKFHVIYWLVFIGSIYGTVYSVLKFISLLLECWRKQLLSLLKCSNVSINADIMKHRLLATLLMINAWTLLCYGMTTLGSDLTATPGSRQYQSELFLTSTPSFMLPWLTLNACMVVFELGKWVLLFFAFASSPDLVSVLTTMLAVTNFFLVRSIRNALFLLSQKNVQTARNFAFE